MKKNFYSMTKTGNEATINIYGDITSFPWLESDVTADSLSKKLEQMKDVSEITVYINSYGGEVAEGLAIYNALKRHKAHITTYCDGFACSIASVIFMAGDMRIMNDSSLLMIHNAWSGVEGNAEKLRKEADALDKITQASIVAYKAHSTLSEKEIVKLMDAETWILPEEAVEYGFATHIEKTINMNVGQSAKKRLLEIVMEHSKANDAEEDPDEEEPEDEEPIEEDQPEEPEDEDEEEASPEDEEDEEEPENEETEEDEEDKEPKEAAVQKWNGFFNALMKM